MRNGPRIRWAAGAAAAVTLAVTCSTTEAGARQTDPAPAVPSSADGVDHGSGSRSDKPFSPGTIQIDPASVGDGDGLIRVTVDAAAGMRAPVVVIGGVGAAGTGGTVSRKVGDAPTSLSLPEIADDGEVRAVLQAVRPDGSTASISSAVWIGTVDGRTIVSDLGPQDRDRKVVAARIANGELSGADAEAAIDVVEAKITPIVTVSLQAACGSVVCLHGTARWTDSNGTTHPIPQASIEVFDENGVTDLRVATATTDDNGNYSAGFNNSDGDGSGRDVYVRIHADGPGFTIGQSVDTTTLFNVAAGDLTIDVVAGNIDTNHVAFSLQAALVMGSRYVQRVSGSYLPVVTVNFPAGGSYYDGTLNLLFDDRWDWDVILHEFGHYVSDSFALDNNPGGQHSGFENLSNRLGKDLGTRLAWGEGWPTYFAISLQQVMGGAALGVPYVGDNGYTDTIDASFTDDLETGATLGEDNEVTVAGLLWDVYDTIPDGLDQGSLGDLAVWQALDAANPTRLSDAYHALSGPTGGNTVVDCASSQANVSPTVSGGPTITTTGNPVTSTWTAGNGGNYPNRSFVVDYSSATNGTLLSTSATLTSASLTPSAATWSAIAAGEGDEAIVGVRATQINSPSTGPYRSCAPSLNGTPTTPSSGTTRYVSLSPSRVLDTRPTSAVNYAGPKPTRGSILTVQISGLGGVPSVGVSAVVVNVTATDASDPGYVTVFPSDRPVPTASNLNLVRKGATRANLVTVAVGSDGAIKLFTEQGTHLIVDVEGYYTPAETATAGRFVALAPARILDTRPGSRTNYTGNMPAAGAVTPVRVLGLGGMPTAGVSAVALNVTALDATGMAFVTVFPHGGAVPTASNVNFDAGGEVRPNQVIVPVSADGWVDVFTEQATNLIIDVAGYYTDATAASSTTGLFVPVSPSRLLDTRLASQTGYSGGKPAAGAVVAVIVPGGGSAAVLNLTQTESDASGFVTAYPAGDGLPTASNLNFESAGLTSPNHAIVRLGAGGAANLYTSAPTHLIADLAGRFT